jgi:gamma-glutamylputrescine oxidase
MASAMSINSIYDMERSYYVATANPFAPASTLQGERRADVVVIGGGYTGLNAALNAAEAGMSVILLEGGRIGWGASGRNGGQMIPGWRKGVVELIARYGEAKARMLFDLALEARSLVLERIGKHGIVCDAHMGGHLTLAAKPSDTRWMQEEVEALLGVMNYPHARLVSAQEARAKAASPIFYGGLLDSWGGHLHPLNYALGLADAARQADVELFEYSRVTAIENRGGVIAHTADGFVRARYGVLACDALLGELDPKLAARVMPVGNYIVATEPLSETPVADDLAISDSRFVVNYFRMSADKRLLFSGGERYNVAPPDNIEAFVRPYLARVFPQLANACISHAWGGLVSVTMTRMPHIGRRGDLFYAHGYSGLGVLLTALAGKALAEAMVGTAKRFDVLASLAPPEFPGGARFRSPLYVLGMLYYALRDRL